MDVKISTPEKKVVFKVTGTKKEDLEKIREFLSTKRHLYVNTGILVYENSGLSTMNVYCPEATLEGVIILLEGFIEKN